MSDNDKRESFIISELKKEVTRLEHYRDMHMLQDSIAEKTMILMAKELGVSKERMSAMHDAAVEFSVIKFVEKVGKKRAIEVMATMTDEGIF